MCQYSAEGAAHLLAFHSHGYAGALRSRNVLYRGDSRRARGRITPGCLGLWDDTTEAALQPIMAAIRKHSKIAVAMQLAHAGRKASSQVPWKGGQQIPVSEGGWVASRALRRALQSGGNAACRSRQRGSGARSQGVCECDPQGRAARYRRHRGARAPTVISSTSSCRRFPTNVPTNMVARSRTGCAFRSRLSMRSARHFPPTSRWA